MQDNRSCKGVISALIAKKGMSKEEVAGVLGISAEQLGEYEDGKTACPLGVLTKLAKISEVTVGQLLGDSEAVPFCLVRGEGRMTVSRFGSTEGKAPGYMYEGLGQQKENRQMEPLLVTLCPSEDHEVKPNEHTGEEFIYVLEGKVKVTLNGHTDYLNPGDSVYYDSRLAHNITCDGTTPAKILAVIHTQEEVIIL